MGPNAAGDRPILLRRFPRVRLIGRWESLSAAGLGSTAGVGFAVGPNSAGELDSVEAVASAVGVASRVRGLVLPGELISAGGLGSTDGVDSANGVGGIEAFDSPGAGTDGVSNGAADGLGLISADCVSAPILTSPIRPFHWELGWQFSRPAQADPLFPEFSPASHHSLPPPTSQSGNRCIPASAAMRLLPPWGAEARAAAAGADRRRMLMILCRKPLAFPFRIHVPNQPGHREQDSRDRDAFDYLHCSIVRSMERT